MNYCLKRPESADHISDDKDEENDVNGVNTCGDGLVSPYKRLKVSDRAGGEVACHPEHAADPVAPDTHSHHVSSGYASRLTSSSDDWRSQNLNGCASKLDSQDDAVTAESLCNFGRTGQFEDSTVGRFRDFTSGDFGEKAWVTMATAAATEGEAQKLAVRPCTVKGDNPFPLGERDLVLPESASSKGSNPGSWNVRFNDGARSGSSSDGLRAQGDSGSSGPGPSVRHPGKRKVLQTEGQLKMAAYLNSGLLTIHIIQGRQFKSGWKPLCDSYVKVAIVPEDFGRKMRFKTRIINDSNSPLFDEKFSLELNHSDEHKRLLVSVWHKDLNSGLSEFLGCTSFGVRNIVHTTKEVNGWYCLLTDEMGRKKHLIASMRPQPSLKLRGHNIPSINKDVAGLESVAIQMTRGKHGFGFSVVEEFPVRVGRVDLASPAEKAGLKVGDFIVRVNSQNVSRSTFVSVAKLVKKSGPTLLLNVHRPRQIQINTLEHSPWKKPDPVYESIADGPTGQQDPHVCHINNCNNLEEENEFSVDYNLTAPYAPFPVGQIPTSTPLPALMKKTECTTADEMKKQEAIHRLLSLELDFSDFMHAGIQRYSRPLRHCVLSGAQHSAIFQNVEKLVTISEYHVKQMQENSPSVWSLSDDDSQSSESNNFAASVALIYQSKVYMFCQAHETYALGVREANRVLSELQHNQDFMRFVKEPPLQPGQPSISAFIFRPLQHIRELCAVLHDIFLHTSPNSPDHATLKQVTEIMHNCVTNISNMSNLRVQSLTSLSSHTHSSKSRSSGTSTTSSSSSSDNLSGGIPVFPVDRHIIFQGDIFCWYDGQWAKVLMVLFSDMLLLMRPNKDGSLHVMSEPILLRNICTVENSKKDSTEIVLRLYESHCNSNLGAQKIVFRAPTIQDKVEWKNLLEQNLPRAKGGHPESMGNSKNFRSGVI